MKFKTKTNQRKIVSPGFAIVAIIMLITGCSTCNKSAKIESVRTSYASQITDSAAEINARIDWEYENHDFISNVKERGFRYSTLKSDLENGGGTKILAINPWTGGYQFWSDLKGLTPNTVYYYLAYVDADDKMFIGDILSFTTLAAGSPNVTTAPVSGIASTSATAGGNLVSDGGNTITEKGVCYSTTANPTIADTKVTVAGTATGNFSANLTGLTASTTYHVKAYAINSKGTSYGADETFTTATVTGAPNVTTTPVNTIATTAAIAGGNLVSDGGNTISEKGVCYSTSANPNTANTKVTVAGTATGNFSANLTGLTASTTYHVKAYAININGTSYGAEETFTTSAVPANNNANFLGTYTMVGNDTFTINTNDIVITANGTSDIIIGNFGNYSPSIDVDGTVSASQVLTIPTQTKGGSYTVSAGTGTISADFKTIAVNYTISAFGYTSNRYQIYTRK